MTLTTCSASPSKKLASLQNVTASRAVITSGTQGSTSTCLVRQHAPKKQPTLSRAITPIHIHSLYWSMEVSQLIFMKPEGGGIHLAGGIATILSRGVRCCPSLELHLLKSARELTTSLKTSEG
jgi:hypothetical protein